jgi:NAD(P)-dependent dehydrogenase (short-subunit alcohol dehydrogenase family)
VNGQPAARTVLVTGASSGIGQATADMFVQAGWRVFGTSRRPRPDWHGVHMLRLDVRSDASVADCVAQVMAQAGHVDVLVNNAGVMHTGMVEETSIAAAHAVFETNLFGAVRVTNAVLPHMRARRQGRIINVGSAAAWVGEPGEAFYAASKQALAGYSEALRHEVWPLGLDVSLVEPGAFTTGILASASTSAGRITDYDAVRQATVRTLQHSLRRGGDPHQVAQLIVKVACTSNPRLRYPIGPAPHWLPLLKVLLPQRLFDHLIRRGYRLPERIDAQSG